MTSIDNNAEFNFEILLMTTDNLTFVYIADSGATSDTTAHEVEITNKKTSSAHNYSTDALGNSVSEKTVGDLKEIICKNQGKELTRTIIKELIYVPGLSFNLFNFSKRLENGYILGGNTTTI